MSIHFENISFAYPEAPLLMKDFSLSVHKGDFVAIVGPSGIGKSTLVSLCLSLLNPTTGSIRMNNLGAAEAISRGHTAVMFQQSALLPWMSLWQNVCFPFEASGTPAPEQEIHDLLDRVGLKTSRHLLPSQLSGGMQTRAALVRALGQNPEFLFLDEPFTGLDQASREELSELVVKLWSTREHTTLMVTHDINEAVYMADHVLVIDERPMKVKLDIEIGFARPRHSSIRQTQQFVDYVARVRNHLSNCCSSGETGGVK